MKVIINKNNESSSLCELSDSVVFKNNIGMAELNEKNLLKTNNRWKKFLNR